MVKKRSKVSSKSHTFIITMPQLAGGPPVKPIKAKAKVRYAAQPVVMHLTDEDAASSIKAGGVGNTQTCTMAHCAQRHSGSFPHPVLGMVDWQYSRAYVVSKLDPKTGLPSECYVYQHRDNTAKLNDSKGGQRKLLHQLQNKGPRMITLLPSRDRTGLKKGNRPTARDGSRSKAVRGTIATKVQGAKLRHAVATRGGIA